MIYKTLNVTLDYKELNLDNGEQHPTLDLYLPDNFPEIDSDRKRPTVIICPGGGYRYTSRREAEPVALKFVTEDFNAVVLNYSCAPARFPASLCEVAWAVKTVKQNAIDWNVDAENIFVCGFSAGGHLAASFGTLWDSKIIKNAFPCQDLSIKGMILCYPVITSGEKAHCGSFTNLLGENATSKALAQVSLEKQVSPTTPPAFIWHTFEDATVPVENSLLFASALRAKNVPFELHIFPFGPHGLSLCTDTVYGPDKIPSRAEENKIWIDLAIAWIKKF